MSSFKGLAENGFGTSLAAKWRYSAVDGSDIAKAVYPSRVDETSSSVPERILWSECGKGSRFGLLPYWTAWITSGTIGFDGAGSSCGSTTKGLCTASSFGCLTTCVWKTQEPFDAFAFEYGCQEDCAVLVVSHLVYAIRHLQVCEHYRGRSRNPEASEHDRVRTNFRFCHQNLCESNKRKFLRRIFRGHAKTKHSTLDTSKTPEGRSATF